MNIFKRNNKFLYKKIKQVPSGIAVRTPDGRSWIIKNDKRFEVPTPRVLDSWSINTIDIVGPVLDRYNAGGVVGFRDGTLIQDMSSGKIYLIENSKRRLLTNPDILDILDWRVILVSKSEADLHTDGEDLNGL